MRTRRRVATAVLAVLAAAMLMHGCSSSHSNSGSGSNSGGGGGGGGGGPTVYGTDVLTYHDDLMRSGEDPSETVLTPQNVNQSSFGKLRILAADGPVDAAPLIVSGLTVQGSMRNVVYIASEHDSVYAYDADSGTLLQHVSLLGAGEAPSEMRNGCSQVSPEIGITSTPVIDRTAGPNGTLFVVAMSKDSSGNYHQRLHALDLLTLTDRIAPQTIQATASGNGPNSNAGMLTFDPAQYKERSALTLLNGQVYLAFASHCDINPYNGWIMAYSESTLTQTSVLAVTPNGTEGSIWATGGMTADASGNLYATIANGTFDPTLNAQGMPSQQDFGNAALKISTSAGLAVTDYFTPYDTVSESANDEDFGSGSMVLLVDQTDNAGTMHQLLIAGGKSGNLYVLDRNNMGRFNAAGDQVYETVAVGGSLFSAPVYFNGTVYVCEVGGTLKAYTFANAMLPQNPSSQTAATFAYPGTSPSISAHGTANAIVWAVQSELGSPAVLYAYNPANLGQEYYDSAQAGARDSFGNGEKFITPVVANGKVFVGTPSGVAVFGLL